MFMFVNGGGWRKMVKMKIKRTLKKASNAMPKSKRAAAARRGVTNTANPTFGAVSTITSAPVAIGNSMSGFTSQTLHTANGCRVLGRDYAFTPPATGTVTNWSIDGGMPLTPACMPSTILRNFVQMYNKFKIRRVAFHYITSSSTTTTGDVVFYFQKNTDSSQINWTSASFLPYVLSDSNTVIGPQWTNHTVLCQPQGAFKSTDYGMNVDMDNYSYGDIFLFSKTSSTESPGYVIFDYDIEFAELSVNPRAGILPTIKAQWAPFSFGFTMVATANTTTVSNATNGTSWIGGVTITAPVLVAGEIYKVILDVTNSTFTNPSNPTNFFAVQVGAGTSTSFVNQAIADGYTCYAAAQNTSNVVFFPNLASAYTASNAMFAGTTGTYSATLRGMIKLVGEQNTVLNQNAY